MHRVAAYTIVCLLISLDARIISDTYNKERRALLDEETITAVGGKQHLNEEEKEANDILMRWKTRELNETYTDTQHFDFSKHYFSYKNDIEKSKVYQIIRKMPKGAVLHVHSSLMLQPDILVKLTYENHLYACFMDDYLRFQFSETTPDRPCPTKWALVSELRNSSGDPDAFDGQLKNYFTLNRDYEDADDYNFMDINMVWERFNKVYYCIKSLISYRPAREKYWYETLKHFYNDNIAYIEVRTGLSKLYELNGTVYEKEYLVELYKNLTRKFSEEHPDFIGVKLIITRHRAQSIDHVLEALNLTRMLKAQMPDMIAGFDLVGQEDLGRPLSDFLPILSEAKNEIDLFLHAGETAWLGTSADENLVDAILLGSKRIGHGYALTKHPSLMTAVIKQDIALEVNVISNVVLSLVHNVRNHPLASYLALGLPVVLSSDDPGAWSAEPLSHDFFVAFMGVASRRSDLRLLKQLAINSITYSALDEKGKTRLLNLFNDRWDKFVKDIISDESLSDINVTESTDLTIA